MTRTQRQAADLAATVKAAQVCGAYLEGDNMHTYFANEYDITRNNSAYLLACPGELRGFTNLPAALSALDRALVSRNSHQWDVAALESISEGRDYCRLFV